MREELKEQFNRFMEGFSYKKTYSHMKTSFIPLDNNFIS